MPKIEEMTQEEVDAMDTALTRYKKENQKFREQRDDYKNQLESTEASAKFKNRALKAEAKLAFSALGVKNEDRFLNYINFDKISVDDEDKIVGLDDEVKRIQGDFPELFDKKRRVGGQVDANANNPAAPKKSVTEMQVDKLFK